MTRSQDRRAARIALANALHDLAQTGLTPTCHNDWRFLDDDRDIRRAMIDHCRECPIFDACHTAGTYEHHGIWGGRDRTPPERRPKELGPTGELTNPNSSKEN